MAVPNQDPVNVSTANGATDTFPYNFLIVDEADLLVTIDDAVQTLNVHYTVTGVGNSSGGNVVFTSMPANGVVVGRERNMEYKRDSDYQTNGDLIATDVNNDYDAAVMMLQQLAALFNRAIKFPVSVDVDGTTLTPEALKGLRWNSSGTAIENYEITGFSAPGGSDLIGFQALGVGAALRTVQDKARERVSLADYGAVAGADVSTAFARAITALSATGGGEIIIGPGTYLVDSMITLNKPGITIRGVGTQAGELSPSITPNGVILKQKNASNLSAVIKITAAGCRLENITIDGNTANQTSGLGRGIWVEQTTGVLPQLSFTRLDRVAVTGTRGQGIYAAPVAGGVLDRMVMVDIQVRDTNGTSIELQDVGDSSFYGVNCGGSFASGANNLKITTCRRLSFYGSIFDFAGNGIAVNVFQSQEINFHGCQAEAAGQHGWYFDGGEDIYLMGCQARSNSSLSAGSYNGFTFVNGVTNIVMQGCRAFDEESPKKQAYGVLLSTTGSAILVGNDLQDNLTGAINLANNANKILIGNLPVGVTNFGATQLVGAVSGETVIPAGMLRQPNTANTGLLNLIGRDSSDFIKIGSGNPNGNAVMIRAGSADRLLLVDAPDTAGAGFRRVMVAN